MDKKRKSLVGWINTYAFERDFKWQAKKSQGSYLGFKEIVIPETRENRVGIFKTKVRITLQELKGVR